MPFTKTVSEFANRQKQIFTISLKEYLKKGRIRLCTLSLTDTLVLYLTGVGFVDTLCNNIFTSSQRRHCFTRLFEQKLKCICTPTFYSATCRKNMHNCESVDRTSNVFQGTSCSQDRNMSLLEETKVLYYSYFHDLCYNSRTNSRKYQLIKNMWLTLVNNIFFIFGY